MGLAELLLTVLNIYSIILFARALMSWFDPTFSNPIGQFLYQVTEPVVEPMRRVLPPMGGLDLSIMLTLFLIVILRQLIAQSLL